MKTRIARGMNEERTLLFWCPGCNTPHGPRVAGPSAWDWNGDRDRPTLSPSVLVRGTRPLTDDEYQRVIRGNTLTPEPLVCHSFVRDGQIQFLGDCTHALAGQTVPIPDWPHADYAGVE